jgi:hypothetical protein
MTAAERQREERTEPLIEKTPQATKRKKGLEKAN